jgi:hypothetical protein
MMASCIREENTSLVVKMIEDLKLHNCPIGEGERIGKLLKERTMVLEEMQTLCMERTKELIGDLVALYERIAVEVDITQETLDMCRMNIAFFKTMLESYKE